MALATDWLPYLALSALAGAVNVVNAGKQLSHDCRYLIFFRPSRVLGVYLWSFAQFAIPAFGAWIVLGYRNHPALGLLDIGKAFGLGVGFVALMNATTQVAGFDLDQLRKCYNWLVYVAKEAIAARETARTAAFWQQCKTELAQVPSLDNGFAYLKGYVEDDISLSPEVRSATLTAIDKVAALPNRAAQVGRIKSLLTVRRRDLPLVLQRFGCSDQLIDVLTH